MAQTVGQQWTEEGVGAGEGRGGDRVAELPGSSAGQRTAQRHNDVVFLGRDPCLLCPYMD